MKDSWKKINEQKANNSPIDVDYIANIDFQDAYCEAEANYQKKINNFANVYLTSFRFLYLEDVEHSSSN